MGKRELKKVTKAKISSLFEASPGIVVEDRKAGSVNYQVVKWEDDVQAIAAVYGSIQHCASIWVKEAAFEAIRPLLPEDAVVEDVAPFRRGFQWAVHIKHPESVVVPMVVEACVTTAAERLSRTKARREADARREASRAEREARRADRRDWRVEPDA